MVEDGVKGSVLGWLVGWVWALTLVSGGVLVVGMVGFKLAYMKDRVYF